MNQPVKAPRVFLLGSESGFCFHALTALMAYPVDVAGVLIASGTKTEPGRPVMRGAIPLAQPGSVGDLAAGQGLVTVHCAHTREAWVRELAREMAPDAVLVACLPERLEAFWMDLARAGCFNLHPSLLPAYRGPAPLFWQLRDGLGETGVTVHRVAAQMDAGPVLVSEAHPIEAGDDLQSLNLRLAAAGARAFAGRLDSLVSGSAALTAQDESKASAHPWPRDADFALDTAWPAERAYRFARGTASLGRVYPVLTEGGEVVVERVLDFDPVGELETAFIQREGVVVIRFAEGTLRAVGKVRLDSRASSVPRG